ncbi:MAG: DUF3343 domain-containing protein [Christensenellaceae bacterium]|jgi:hypothetical protein|nr:DUF3343 domain-containing protein [Christensenellaceae bacterium]
MTQEYLLLAFESTHAAIAAQKALSALGVILIPTLRAITASCGMSLRFALSARQQALDILSAHGISGWTLYQVRQEGNRVLEVTPL